jgi:hypothetical protein
MKCLAAEPIVAAEILPTGQPYSAVLTPGELEALHAITKKCSVGLLDGA